MADENGLKTSNAVGLSGTESPVKSPVDVPDLPSRGLAQRWFDGQFAFSEIEEGLGDIGGFEDFDRLGGDHYDNSIEIHGASPEARLPAAARVWLLETCGFSKIYLNHTDGWETHYHPTCPNGWRRRYVSDPGTATTNVIIGDSDPGYFEISYWPEGWTNTEWLETGYMRIVPDPLAAA